MKNVEEVVSKILWLLDEIANKRTKRIRYFVDINSCRRFSIEPIYVGGDPNSSVTGFEIYYQKNRKDIDCCTISVLMNDVVVSNSITEYVKTYI